MTRLSSSARAVSLVMNPMIRDRRVEQTAAVLASEVGSTIVYAFDRTGRLPAERRLGPRVLVHRLGAAPGRKPGVDTERAAISTSVKSDRGQGTRNRLKRALIPLALVARSLRYNLQAIRVMRRNPPALILANDLPTLPAAIAAKQMGGSAVVYDTHEIYTERVTDRPLDGLWRKVERAVERFLIGRVDLVVTVSDSAAEYLANLHDLSDVPLVVRSIPAESQSGEPLDRSLRDDIGVGDDARVIVYTGVMAPARAVDLAVRALAKIEDRTVHLAAVGYGDRSHLDSLLGLAEQSGVADRFHLVDPVPSDSVVGYIADADLAVIPGKPVTLNSAVALPNKLFEAIAAGLPLVVNDKPEITRFVRTHGVGLVVDCEDRDQFGQALRSVIDNRERWTEAVSSTRSTMTWTAEATRLSHAIQPLTKG